MGSCCNAKSALKTDVELERCGCLLSKEVAIELPYGKGRTWCYLEVGEVKPVLNNHI